MANLTLIPSAKVPLVYEGENTMTTEWYRFFWNIYGFTGAGVVPVDKGGTGLNTIGDHQVIIGNSNNVFEPAVFTGTGINISYSPGVINLAIGASGVTPGTYGSASQVGVFTVNQYGNITAATNTSIGINASQITSGIIDSARISGSYVGIVGVGTLIAGTWNASTIGVDYGGTGQTSYTNGQLLIGNTTGNTLTKATLTAGSGVTITNGAGSITISATGTGGTVTSVSGTSPISVATGTTTPVISISQATTSTNGYLSSTDWNTFNNKQPAGTYVTSISIASSNGFTGTSSGGATPSLTLATSVTGILKGNGTAISAATSGTDYAPATSGTSILYGNGAGGFSNVTIGTGVSFAGGTLSATGSGGTVTSVAALTLGTAGTDLSSTVANSTTTPVITLNVPTASSTNRGALSSTDWSIFNSKAPGVTFTTNYIPYGQGTTTLNQSSGLQYDGSNLTVTNNANAIPNIRINNPNAGSSAGGQFIWGNDADSAIAYIQQNSSTNTTLGGGNSLNIFSKAGNFTLSTVNTERLRVTTNGGISFGATGTAYGTSGQILQSNGDAPPSWINNTVGTVTSVAALTLGTTGTDLSSTVANGTTTPVITLNVPTASATNRGALSAADWSTFNSKAPGVTFTTGYVPFGQGSTTLNQSSTFTYDGTILTTPAHTLSSGNLNFSGAAQRITGDFSGTLANRVHVQSNVVNGFTSFGLIPNGTSTQTQINWETDSALTNGVTGQIALLSTEFKISTAFRGTGAYVPMTFVTGGSERLRISTAGNVGIGTPTPGFPLDVVCDASALGIRSRGRSADSISVLRFTSNDGATTYGQFDVRSNIFFVNAVANIPLAFNTNNTERMRLFASGGLSLGNTTDPGATNLSVTGSATAAIHNTLFGTTGSIANGASTDIVTTAVNKGHYRLSANAAGNTTVWCSYYIYFDGGGTATLVSTAAVGMTASSSGANKITLTNSAGSAQSLEWSVIRYK